MISKENHIVTANDLVLKKLIARSGGWASVEQKGIGSLMGSGTEPIFSYYEQSNEELRLREVRSRQTEFYTTNWILERYLKPKSKLLELGAATGIYSIYYAQKGHQVWARDLVPQNINKLIAKPECSELRIDAGVADARDLSEFEDDSFDAVLCLGPFYHLGRLDDRKRCLSESLRVLKPGGVLAVAYLLRLFLAVRMIQKDRRYLSKELHRPIMDHQIALQENPENIWFADRAEEIQQLMSEFPVTHLTNAGTDGIGILLSDLVNSFSDEEYRQWLEYHLETCEEPSILGYSNHGLYVCRKK